MLDTLGVSSNEGRKSGRIGDCCVTHDLILGHESAGQIIEVGSNVVNLHVGDRVSIEPGVSCWE
jgi:L-iditol 2-dehydrogenase